MALTLRDLERKGKSECIDNEVDLRGQTPT
jgi:hypothetical protein